MSALRPLGTLLFAALAALAASLLSSAPAAADETPEATYETSPSGHRFRTSFDPASRIALGLAGVLERGPGGGPAGAPELTAGIWYRNVSASGAGRERVSWQIDHRIVDGWVEPLGHAGGTRLPVFDASLYSANLLRHDASPSLVLPTSPPVGIPFPFDVGIDTEVGHVTAPAFAPAARAPGKGAVPALHVGVARAALLLDPWRSGVAGRSFEIGLGARYDVDVQGAPTLASPRLIHRVAPMTAGSLRFRAQSLSGRSAADVRAEVAPQWTSEGRWALMASSAVRLSRVLVALDDQPIAAVLDGGYRLYPATHRAESASDFHVSLGLSVDLQLH